MIAFLPETKNCRLPDTLQEGEQFGKYVAHIHVNSAIQELLPHEGSPDVHYHYRHLEGNAKFEFPLF